MSTSTVTPAAPAASPGTPSVPAASGRRGALARRDGIAGMAMAAPSVILLSLFLIIPVCLAFGLSFTNARLISPNPPRFVGLDNLARAFTDPVFLRSTLNMLPQVSRAGRLAEPMLPGWLGQ